MSDWRWQPPEGFSSMDVLAFLRSLPDGCVDLFETVRRGIGVGFFLLAISDLFDAGGSHIQIGRNIFSPKDLRSRWSFCRSRRN